jgi:hypothetical protein
MPTKAITELFAKTVQTNLFRKPRHFKIILPIVPDVPRVSITKAFTLNYIFLVSAMRGAYTVHVILPQLINVTTLSEQCIMHHSVRYFSNTIIEKMRALYVRSLPDNIVLSPRLPINMTVGWGDRLAVRKISAHI